MKNKLEMAILLVGGVVLISLLCTLMGNLGEKHRSKNNELVEVTTTTIEHSPLQCNQDFIILKDDVFLYNEPNWDGSAKWHQEKIYPLEGKYKLISVGLDVCVEDLDEKEIDCLIETAKRDGTSALYRKNLGTFLVVGGQIRVVNCNTKCVHWSTQEKIPINSYTGNIDKFFEDSFEIKWHKECW